MKRWPVPNSYSKVLPKYPEPGSFWKFREDRHHCGVDIYAPKGSQVIAVEKGSVIETGIFTLPNIIPYWNETYYVIVRHESGIFGKYAEMGKILVKVGDDFQEGETIGYVGEVLNLAKVTEKAPAYIQNLKENGNGSMLHFELYDDMPRNLKEYLGGNVFNGRKPNGLIDPMDYFK